MIINELEIKNFRGYFGNNIFTFKPDGVTLILGNAGSGKTTIINAIDWLIIMNESSTEQKLDTISTYKIKTMAIGEEGEVRIRLKFEHNGKKEITKAIFFEKTDIDKVLIIREEFIGYEYKGEKKYKIEGEKLVNSCSLNKYFITEHNCDVLYDQSYLFNSCIKDNKNLEDVLYYLNRRAEQECLSKLPRENRMDARSIFRLISEIKQIEKYGFFLIKSSANNIELKIIDELININSFYNTNRESLEELNIYRKINEKEIKSLDKIINEFHLLKTPNGRLVEFLEKEMSEIKDTELDLIDKLKEICGKNKEAMKLNRIASIFRHITEAIRLDIINKFERTRSDLEKQSNKYYNLINPSNSLYKINICFTGLDFVMVRPIKCALIKDTESHNYTEDERVIANLSFELSIKEFLDKKRHEQHVIIRDCGTSAYLLPWEERIQIYDSIDRLKKQCIIFDSFGLFEFESGDFKNIVKFPIYQLKKNCIIDSGESLHQSSLTFSAVKINS